MKERTKQRIEQLRELYNQSGIDQPISEEEFMIFAKQDKELMYYLKHLADPLWEMYLVSAKMVNTPWCESFAKSKSPSIQFDWSCLPAWCNSFIAMDKNKDWYCYNLEPKLPPVGTMFAGNGSKIPPHFAPKNFTGDFRDSLMKNPNKNPAK